MYKFSLIKETWINVNINKSAVLVITFLLYLLLSLLFKKNIVVIYSFYSQDTEKSPKKAAAKKKSSEEKGIGGTVRPAQPFNPVVDSERLFDALDGVGADEVAIIEILPHRSNGQRQEIKAKYQDKFSQVMWLAGFL